MYIIHNKEYRKLIWGTDFSFSLCLIMIMEHPKIMGMIVIAFISDSYTFINYLYDFVIQFFLLCFSDYIFDIQLISPE